MNALEVYLGAFRSMEAEKNVKQADNLFISMGLLELNLKASRKSSEILSELLRKGEPSI